MATVTSIFGLDSQPAAKNIALVGVGTTPPVTRVSDSSDTKTGRSGQSTYRQNNFDPVDCYTLRVDWERLAGGAMKYATGLWVPVNRLSDLTDKSEYKNLIVRNELIVPMGFGITDDHLIRAIGQATMLHLGRFVDANGLNSLANVHTALLGTANIF